MFNYNCSRKGLLISLLLLSVPQTVKAIVRSRRKHGKKERRRMCDIARGFDVRF